MLSVLLLGFLIGLRHAFEADHVVAVASLAADKSPRHAVTQGVVWGFGHTLTLLIVGGVVLAADGLIPDTVADSLELVVGIMLVILGGDLIRRAIAEKWHIHTHKHADGRRHIHLHSHAGTVDRNVHEHEHVEKVPVRALLVGIMHGLAGSAALILLTLQTVPSTLVGVFYIILFGVGSIAGMALLSLCIAVPMNLSARRSTGLRNAFSAVIGLTTLCLGGYTIYEIGLVNGLLLS